MVPLPIGAVDPRTGRKVEGYANWTSHPNNPASPNHATSTPAVARIG